MKHDIFFRGKRVDNGEWVYGYVVHRTKYYGESDDKWFILHGGEFDCDYYDAEEVDPDTVGQYTGLCDNDGKKIFEGDIINTIEYFGKNRLFTVVFENGMFSVEGSALKSWCHPTFGYRVVGNIYDNPDMVAEQGEG